MDDLDHMNAAQLKALCKECGLKMSGKKADLQDRLRDHFTTRHDGHKEKGDADCLGAKIDGMTAVKLKAMCKEHGLKVSGKKSDLQERLREYFVANGSIKEKVHDEFESMSDGDLRDALVVRGLSGSGERSEVRNSSYHTIIIIPFILLQNFLTPLQLLARIRNDVEYAQGVMKASSPNNVDGYIALSDALEAAAKVDGSKLSEILAEVRSKAQAEPKFMDVTITSLGLSPHKFTAGGAPSVTADGM